MTNCLHDQPCRLPSNGLVQPAPHLATGAPLASSSNGFDGPLVRSKRRVAPDAIPLGRAMYRAPYHTHASSPSPPPPPPSLASPRLSHPQAAALLATSPAAPAASLSPRSFGFPRLWIPAPRHHPRRRPRHTPPSPARRAALRAERPLAPATGSPSPPPPPLSRICVWACSHMHPNASVFTSEIAPMTCSPRAPRGGNARYFLRLPYRCSTLE